MRRWFNAERSDIVFHAAALKQVPLVEKFPGEGVLTNVSGLKNVAEAAHAVGAELIFVSTDKAVDPSGAMGATKRLGDRRPARAQPTSTRRSWDPGPSRRRSRGRGSSRPSIPPSPSGRRRTAATW